MLHPDIVEGTIARYCGRLAGNVNGGLSQMLTPRRRDPPYLSKPTTPCSVPRATPQRGGQADLLDMLQRQIIQLHEEIAGDVVLINGAFGRGV